ncbi:mas-related G-protein coupled receptor member H-like [Erythrolamprus reginae]|uniref:mas-related G-protein coupled receptor member H-like n=1 Tax=Erythrolamprus reginae TaxID=121349 RepID=UPI00396C5028
MTSPFPSSSKTSKCYNSEITEEMLIFAIFTILFCVLGMLGNGLVIRLLGCSVKRNTFAIYIINLSVAHFGLLTIKLIIEIYWLSTGLYCGFPYELFRIAWLLMYNLVQFLLTIISIDRCVSVLFPIWYRSHRLAKLFAAVSVITWAISFILSSIYFKNKTFHRYEWENILIYAISINAVLLFSLMTISTVTLFIKICFLSKRQRWGKLLTVILLMLFSFLVLVFPLNASIFSLLISRDIVYDIIHRDCLCIYIHACINPVIYYVVGRQGGKGIKDFFQKVFKEEEELSTDERETSEGCQSKMQLFVSKQVYFCQSLLLKNTPEHDAATTMFHRWDGIGQEMSGS